MRTSTRRAPAALKIVTMLIASVLMLTTVGVGVAGAERSDRSTAAKPKQGGKVVYGLEGATTSFCLPQAQLAISGIMVTQSVYDTLTEPDSKGVFRPYLAQSVTPNATYDQWTITLRPGIKFHDGSPLNAAAVKQNIDAWKSGLLLSFVFQDVGEVTTPDDMTVVVNTKVPWVAFPAYLWSTGRAGIAAPAQLNNEETCDTNMIGTGPFSLKSFDPTSGDVDVVRNPNYWRNGYPYLDEIVWKVQEDGQVRATGLQGGQFDVIHDTSGADLTTIQGFGSGFATEKEPAGYREIAQGLVNVTKAPLNDLSIRKAITMGTDRDALNQIANDGKWTISDSVLDSKVMGYVKNPGFPQYNPSKAKKLVTKYRKAHGNKPVTFSLQATFDAQTQALAKQVKLDMSKIGITVKLPSPVDQATIINQAIGSAVDAFLWRNYPGTDPDTLYVWFKGGSTVNFNHVDDPVLNKALDQGRSETDVAKRTKIYETFNKRMSSQVYNLFTYYETWFVSHTTNVKGILGPNLPNASGAPGKYKPAQILAGYHQLIGMWKS